MLCSRAGVSVPGSKPKSMRKSEIWKLKSRKSEKYNRFQIGKQKQLIRGPGFFQFFLDFSRILKSLKNLVISLTNPLHFVEEIARFCEITKSSKIAEKHEKKSRTTYKLFLFAYLETFLFCRFSPFSSLFSGISDGFWNFAPLHALSCGVLLPGTLTRSGASPLTLGRALALWRSVGH